MSEEVWCSARSKLNTSPAWRDCKDCCAVCKTPCKRPPCSTKGNFICAWRRKPTEWLAERLFGEGESHYFYNKARYRDWMRKGFRAEDVTWEGQKLLKVLDTDPELYKELLEEVENECRGKGEGK